MSFRVVQQDFWKDEKVLELFSCEDKYFFLYLLTNPSANQLGIYKLPPKLMAFELGYSKEQVMVLIDRFISYGVIRYNYDTQEIAVGKYLYHSIVKGGKPVMDAIHKDMEKVNDLQMFLYVFKKLTENPIDEKKETLLSIVDELKKLITNNNIKDNDNDNDDSLTIRVTIREEKEKLSKLRSDFETIYSIYPNKKGKETAFFRYRKWVSKSGYLINGKTYHLTNKQIWYAVKKYVDQLESKDTDLQYYKGFDVLLGDALLDYVDFDN